MADYIGHIHGINLGARIRIGCHTVVVVGRHCIVSAVSPIPGKCQIIATGVGSVPGETYRLVLVRAAGQKRIDDRGHTIDRYDQRVSTFGAVIISHGYRYRVGAFVTINMTAGDRSIGSKCRAWRAKWAFCYST